MRPRIRRKATPSVVKRIRIRWLTSPKMQIRNDNDNHNLDNNHRLEKDAVAVPTVAVDDLDVVVANRVVKDQPGKDVVPHATYLSTHRGGSPHLDIASVATRPRTDLVNASTCAWRLPKINSTLDLHQTTSNGLSMFTTDN